MGPFRNVLQAVAYFLLCAVAFAATAHGQWTYAFMDRGGHPATMSLVEFRNGVDLGFAQLDDALQERFKRVPYDQSPNFRIWVNDYEPALFGTAWSDLRGNMYFGTGIFADARDTTEMRVAVGALLCHEMISHTMTGRDNSAHRLNPERTGFADEFRSGIRGFDKTIGPDDRFWLSLFGWHPKPTINRWSPLMTLRNRPPTLVPRNRPEKTSIDTRKQRWKRFDPLFDDHDPDGDELRIRNLWAAGKRGKYLSIVGNGRAFAYEPKYENGTRITGTDTVWINVYEVGNPTRSYLTQWESMEITIK